MSGIEFFKIDPQKMSQFMLKRGMFLAGVILVIILVLALLISILAGVNPLNFLLTISPFSVAMIFIVFVFGFMNQSQFAAKRYGIGQEMFIMLHDENQLSALAKYGMRRNEIRYGQKNSEIIMFRNVYQIIQKRDKLIIKSYDYNFFTGGGRIVVPKELENYDQFVALIKENLPRKLK